MNPIRAGAVEELRKVSRNVFCKHYDGCLDLTLQRGWKSPLLQELRRFQFDTEEPARLGRGCAEMRRPGRCCIWLRDYA